MTDSAVLDTVCLGWFSSSMRWRCCAAAAGGDDRQLGQKRAKYLLRGIQDLLDDIAPEHGDLPVAGTGWDRMQNTAQTVLLNGRVESQRYDAMLQAKPPLRYPSP